MIRTMLVAALAAVSFYGPAASFAQSKQLALNNVSGSQLGPQLAGRVCTGVWEVDTKVAGGAADFGAYRVKFTAEDDVLKGTWEGVLGKVAHDAPHAAHFKNPGNLLVVRVTGNRLDFTSRFGKLEDRGIRWSAIIRQNGAAIELTGGTFTPKDARPDWSDGKFTGLCR